MREPASLDVVADTVRRELDALERRIDAADARAGLVLGFAGLIASFGSEGWLPLTLGARLLAVLAGLAALCALAATRAADAEVADLSAMLHADRTTTRLAVLAGDTHACRARSRGLDVKLAWLRLASGSVAASLVFSVVGATVEGVR